MSFKRNIIIALVLLIMAGLYFTIYSLKSKKEQKKEEVSRYFTEPIDAIITFELENENGEFVLTKRDDIWYISKPIQAKADLDTIRVMLSNLAGAKRTNPFKADELEPYGLDKPESQIDLVFKEPDKKLSILFGKQSTSPGKFFSKFGIKRIIN